jgi:hypothetical protein
VDDMTDIIKVAEEEIVMFQRPSKATSDALIAEVKRLRDLVADYNQNLGNLGLFLSNGEYLKAEKEYNIFCDRLDERGD